MAQDPAFASVINIGSALLSAGAETDLQVPTKTAVILTAGASGTKVEEIVAEMTSTGAGGLVATSVAGLIYLFAYDGATYHLFDTISVRAITASTTVAPYRSVSSDFASATSRPPNLFLKSGWSLRASQSVAANQSATLGLKVSAFGADLQMPSRGVLSGVKPLPDVPDWIGGGDPANDGMVLEFDSSKAGGAAPSNIVVPSAVTPRSVQVGGNITVPSSASYLEIATQTGGPGAGGLDVSVSAVAGDTLLVALNISAVTVNPQYLQVDLVTVANGSRVNYLGQSANLTANNGLWAANTSQPVSIVLQYVVQAADVFGGAVIIRPLGVASSSTVTIGRSAGSGPFVLSLSNHKQ